MKIQKTEVNFHATQYLPYKKRKQKKSPYSQQADINVLSWIYFPQIFIFLYFSSVR